MLGSWEINLAVGKMPEKVATAVGELSETLIGAEYTPIAYLGSQVVNGTNHAVLAEQLLVTGKDTKNVVLLIFNEKVGDMKATLVNIERVVEGGAPLGGIDIDVKTEIPEEAKEAFDAAFEGFVGSNVVPFALLGTQVTRGTDYIFAAELTTVTKEPQKSIALVVVNGLDKKVTIAELLKGGEVVTKLGYAFTWLR